MRTAVWPNAIQHSKSVEWHFSCAKWHVAPLSNIHAILCDFVFSDIFFKDQLTFKKILFFSFGSNEGILMCLTHLFSRNHHLHHCFQKLIKSSFLRLMNSCSKLGAFAHGSFILKKNHQHLFEKKKIIITKISKNHAFILN